MKTPELWSLERVRALDPASTVVWVTPSVRSFAETLPFRIHDESIPDNARTLIAIGGGTLLDRAKIVAVERGLTLVAIPSIWGSGAEASPVVVQQRGLVKEIRMGDEYVPDARVVWSELADRIPQQRAREACGDAWSHALEGFLSPLANDEVRRDGAQLMADMIDVGIGSDARWFELSARACALQARSSVGLIHGIAHVLEGPLGWGHARLCATFFRPVLDLDARSEKVAQRFSDHAVDVDALRRTGEDLFERDSYGEAVKMLPELWPSILRDRCTRTNAILIRQTDLEFFQRFAS